MEVIQHGPNGYPVPHHAVNEHTRYVIVIVPIQLLNMAGNDVSVDP